MKYLIAAPLSDEIPRRSLGSSSSAVHLLPGHLRRLPSVDCLLEAKHADRPCGGDISGKAEKDQTPGRRAASSFVEYGVLRTYERCAAGSNGCLQWDSQSGSAGSFGLRKAVYHL